MFPSTNPKFTLLILWKRSQRKQTLESNNNIVFISKKIKHAGEIQSGSWYSGPGTCNRVEHTLRSNITLKTENSLTKVLRCPKGCESRERFSTFNVPSDRCCSQTEYVEFQRLGPGSCNRVYHFLTESTIEKVRRRKMKTLRCPKGCEFRNG